MSSARDTRHSATTILQVRDVPARLFLNWTMGRAMRTPATQEVYLRHGLGGALEPSRLKSDKLIGLALNLQAFEVIRRQERKRTS